MVQVPLMVLAIQPGGTMTIRRAEELLRACPSQGRLYWVVCCECNPPPPTGSADDDMSKRAYHRALCALDMPDYKDAVAAIGLHSHTVQLSRTVSVRKASLALVERNALDKPPFLCDASGSMPITQARLVAEALKNWNQYKGMTLQGPSVAASVAIASFRHKTA